MKLSARSYVLAGLALGVAALALVAQERAVAQGNGNGNGGSSNGAAKNVIVVNGVGDAIPVSGNISVAGVTTVAGIVDAVQGGPWTVGLDPLNNTVRVAGSPGFHFDGGFDGMNDGVTVELGPFDTSGLGALRILARAVNGDVRFEVLHGTEFGGFVMDDFTLNGESGNRYATFVYEVPPPSLRVRLTESGPGGANFHVVLTGR